MTLHSEGSSGGASASITLIYYNPPVTIFRRVRKLCLEGRWHDSPLCREVVVGKIFFMAGL